MNKSKRIIIILLGIIFIIGILVAIGYFLAKSSVLGGIIVASDKVVVVDVPGEEGARNFQFNDKTVFSILSESGEWIDQTEVQPKSGSLLHIFYVNNFTNPPTIIRGKLEEFYVPQESDILIDEDER